MALRVSEWPSHANKLHIYGWTRWLQVLRKQNGRPKPNQPANWPDKNKKTHILKEALSEPSSEQRRLAILQMLWHIRTVLLLLLLFYAQSQRTNLTRTDSFILMKGGLLRWKCHSRREEQAFGCYQKTLLQFSLSPNIHWIENANFISVQNLSPISWYCFYCHQVITSVLHALSNLLTGPRTHLVPAHPTLHWKQFLLRAASSNPLSISSKTSKDSSLGVNEAQIPQLGI